MSYDSAMGEVLKLLLGTQGPVAVLLKEIRDSNLRIEGYLAGKRDVVPELDANVPPRKDAFEMLSSAPSLVALWERSQNVVLDGLAYKTAGVDHAPRPAAPPITREQIEAAIDRGMGMHSLAAWGSDHLRRGHTADLIMEVINGRR